MPARIIDFERQPGFYYESAKRKLAEGRYNDALKLIQKSVSAAPDKSEYLLELARIYNALDLTEYCRIAVTKALAHGCAVDDALYILAESVFADGDAECSKKLLRNGKSPDCRRLLADINIGTELCMPVVRRSKRALKWQANGCRLLRSGHYAEAAAYFEKYLQRFPETDFCRMMLARALSEYDRKAALEQAETALSGEAPDPAMMVIYAEVLEACGQAEKAKQVIASVEPFEPNIGVACLNLLIKLKDHGAVYELSGRLIEKGWLRPEFLHYRSVSACVLGKAPEEVKEGWEQLLSLAPDDFFALYNIEYGCEGLSYLMDYRKAAERHSKTDAAKTAAVLLNRSDDEALYALSIAADSEEEVCRNFICQAAVRPDFAPVVRKEAQNLVKKLGLNIPEAFRPLRRACRQEMEEILSELPARHAKIIEDAACYGVDGDKAAALWKGFVKKVNPNVLENADADCAALICLCKLKENLKPDYHMIMSDYRVRPRQLKRVLKPLYIKYKIEEDVENAF